MSHLFQLPVEDGLDGSMEGDHLGVATKTLLAVILITNVIKIVVTMIVVITDVLLVLLHFSFLLMFFFCASFLHGNDCKQDRVIEELQIR